MTYYPRAYLFLIAVPVFALLACFLLSRAIEPRANPYSAALAYTSEEVHALASCYTDSEFRHYDFGQYCILQTEHGHVTFSFTGAGNFSAISFWRYGNMQVGDIYALYGKPLSIRSTRYFTNTTFATANRLILVSARENTLYAQVRFLWVSFR